MAKSLENRLIGNTYKNVLTGAFQTCTHLKPVVGPKGPSFYLCFDTGAPVLLETLSVYLKPVEIDENAN